MCAARRNAQNNITSAHRIETRQERAALRRAERKTGEIKIACGVEAGHFGGFAAREHAAGLPASFRDPRDDACAVSGAELAGRVVIEKQQRLGALGQEVVHTHGHQVDANRIKEASLDSDLQFSAHAVGGGQQNRIAKAGGLEIERRGESAERPYGAGPLGGARGWLDEIDEAGAFVNIDAGRRVSEAVRPFAAAHRDTALQGRLDLTAGVARRRNTPPERKPVMKMPSLAGIAALAALAFCALAPAPASAQAPRGSVYTVSGVRVDAPAQQQAFAQGRQSGFERLVQRITLPDELARIGMPRPDAAALERLVLSLDVEDERRSGARYIGRVSLRFDPNGVRNLLRQAGLAIADQRGAAILVVPLWTNVPAATGDAWRAAWEQGGFGDELVPLITAPRTLVGAPNWVNASPHAQTAGAARALYLDLRVNGANASAAMVEVGANGLRRDRGQVQARINAGDQGLATALQSLAEQASARLQNEWKTTLATGSGQRARVSASALYANQAEWQRIKAGLEAAAATMISEIRIEAVARQGALVSFSFVGDRTALAAELRRHGVVLDETQTGPVLRTAGR